MSIDPVDLDDLRSLARLFGVDLDEEGDALDALARELEDLLAEGRIYAQQELGELGPSVGFTPLE